MTMTSTIFYTYLAIGCAIGSIFLLGFVEQRVVQNRLARRAGFTQKTPLIEHLVMVVAMVALVILWPVFLIVTTHGAGTTVALGRRPRAR